MLNDAQLKEIDSIFKKFNDNEEELLKALEQFKNPDDSFPIEIRWKFDEKYQLLTIEESN